MATKKKPTAKGARAGAAKRRPSSSRSRSVAAQQTATLVELQAATKTIQYQVVCFTVLSVVFAVMAFWRYGQ